ncbi:MULTISPECIES: DUF1120 domain-containing protein [Burkholderia]|jgi:type 1 fimbria pilin|uniref:DUF1120 domain-containing protein n=3 Tax=Burkholderia TaxID=32008 RepID=A0A1E3FQC7_9BURK|nr:MULTISPECIES: DUF1120 domain-containing protein [Burkholderia]KKL40124.1 hypothetical protein WR31_19950 [Burkholderia contaminans LMG 23361]MBA9834455.1 DUF1120 domain-containing protein [Burkholderia contaminans]MBA9840200.1 DUF1120 domain-containing protein [Burkholderia contaminans]MBA9865231.1 DUF1120 domain-containing protein [Burkholderia contaminans]MBA9908114.1 DUF1120 domain-containing protein [Burkholderia contaminans]
MTMKRLPPSLLASTLLLSAGHVLAGTDLSVTGHIQSGACNLTLSNGGTIDLGTLSRKDLKENEETYRWRRDVTLALDCQTPAKVAIKAINNRETVMDPKVDVPMYQLGPAGSKSRFWFGPLDRFGDGKPLLQLYSSDGGQTWGASDTVTSLSATMYPSSLTAWAEEGETLPQAFQTIRSKLEFNIWLPALRDLDLSQEIALDGSATLELVYL